MERSMFCVECLCKERKAGAGRQIVRLTTWILDQLNSKHPVLLDLHQASGCGSKGEGRSALNDEPFGSPTS